MTYLVTNIAGERSSGLLIVERNRKLENRYSKYVDSLVIYVFIYLFIYLFIFARKLLKKRQ